MTARTTDTAAYYARRANEYERVYSKPERQGDLAALRKDIAALLVKEDVLEIACGTGYWTELISRLARSVLATDVNEEVLQIAGRRTCPRGNVRFARRDAFAMAGISGEFTAIFAGFFWSHVPLRRIPEFLATLHAKLCPGGLVVLVDNNYVAGSSTPISSRDTDGNTYQRRSLDDGSMHEILKNFPSEGDLRNAIGNCAVDSRHVSLRYYWCLTYRTRWQEDPGDCP